MNQEEAEIKLYVLQFLATYDHIFRNEPSLLWRFYTDDSILRIGNYYTKGAYQTYRQIFDFSLQSPEIHILNLSCGKLDQHYTTIIKMSGLFRVFNYELRPFTREITLFNYRPGEYSILYDYFLY